MNDFSDILSAIEQGDPHASEKTAAARSTTELRPYSRQPRRLAHEQPGQTLQATALVHEAYLRLLGGKQTVDWGGRRHFFAAAAEAMRRILVDRARHKQTKKAGGGRRRLDLDDVEPALEEENGDRVVALDEALRQLEAEDPRKARAGQARVLAATHRRAEAAAVLGVSSAPAEEGLGVRSKSWLQVAIDRMSDHRTLTDQGKNVTGSAWFLALYSGPGPRRTAVESCA